MFVDHMTSHILFAHTCPRYRTYLVHELNKKKSKDGVKEHDTYTVSRM